MLNLQTLARPKALCFELWGVKNYAASREDFLSKDNVSQV